MLVKIKQSKIIATFLVIFILFFNLPLNLLADTINVNLEVTGGGGGGGGGGGEEPPIDPPIPVPGCTDLLAQNYNPGATVDDGTCLYLETVPNVLNFNATLNQTDQMIELEWTNPSFPNFDGVRIVRQIDGLPVDESDGELIYDGSGGSAVDDDLSEVGVYFYVAFVRNSSGEYSSGVIDQVTISEDEVVPPDEEVPPEEELPPGEENPDPFADFPEATNVDPLIAKLELADFRFIQIGEPLQFFGLNTVVRLKGDKPFTVSLPYDSVPEVLKTIGVTLTHPSNSSKSFSFLLRLNSNKTAYEATIQALPDDGSYGLNIYVLNFEDQTMRRIKGVLQVAGITQAKFTEKLVSDILSPLSIGTGIVAGVTQAVLLTSNVASLADLYLLILRGFGALTGFLGLRRRHRPWGTVYDSVTKRPIDPAYVSVEALTEAGKEMASAITDIDGRYGFFLPAGSYLIKAGKTHYEFPSKKLAGQTRDELYGDLYFGEPVETKGEEVINKNIPLDPVGFDWNEFAKTKTNFFQVYSQKEIRRTRIFNVIYGLGFLTASVSMAITPSTLNLVVLGVYLSLYLLRMFWQMRHKVIKVSLNNGEPISYAIIRFFIAELNQEVKHVVTDALGRFYVLIRPGTYYFTVEEKKADGTYEKVYQSDNLELKKGVLENNIVITRKIEASTQPNVPEVTTQSKPVTNQPITETKTEIKAPEIETKIEEKPSIDSQTQ